MFLSKKNLANLYKKRFVFLARTLLGTHPQSCLYFQGFRGSKLLNVCLVVRQSNLCLGGIQLFSGFGVDNDQQFSIFSQLYFGVFSVLQLFYVYCKGKNPLFFNLQFLLLLSERGLSLGSCLAISHLLINRLLINKVYI